MSATAAPAFDPASPDAPLLEAYESIRAARGYCYRYDSALDPAREAELERHDEVSLAGEAIINGAWATTAAGIRTRLQLLLVDQTAERWVDEALVSHGLSAVLQRRGELDGNGQQLLLACEELLHLEWEDALATYEKSVVDYELALSAQGLLTEFRQAMLEASGHPGAQFLSDLRAYCDTAERQLCNNAQICQLMRTLAPTHQALSLKIKIALKEGYSETAVPWIARDVAFLAGATINPEHVKGER